jgi:hypothetical protein
VSDNLRKGAATNAVQIAEELVKRFGLQWATKKLLRQLFLKKEAAMMMTASL